MGIIYHKGVPYASGTINEETPYGTSAPSGGSDGDLYIQIDNNGNIVKVWQNHNNTWGYLSGGGCSDISVNPEYDTGTLLATISVDDVDHEIYAPEANNIMSGAYTPSANVGEDNDIFIKYDVEDVETEYSSVMSEQSISMASTKTATVNLDGKYHVKIIVKSGYSPNPVLNTVIELVSEMDNRIQLMSDLVLTINDTTWTIQNTQFNTSYKVSASATELLSSTPTGVNTPYVKLEGAWFPFPDNEGSEVIANPEDAATDVLTKLSVDGDVYEIPDSGSTNSYGYNVPSDSEGANGDIYCKISDISGEDECVDSTITFAAGTWTAVPLPRDSTVYTTFVMGGSHSSSSSTYNYTHTYDTSTIGTSEGTATSVYGYNNAVWGKMYKSVSSLYVYINSGTFRISSLVGAYTDAHAVNDIYQKVEGSWAKSSSSEVNYSTEEQVIGTWIDGKPLYQKTVEVTSITRSAWNAYLVDENAVVREISGWYADANNKLPLGYYNGSVIMNRQSDGNSGYFSLYGSGTLSTATVTVRYTKTID